MPRAAIVLLCVLAVLAGPAATAQADSTTQLPFGNGSAVWLAVDPSGSHVFVSGGPGTSSIVVLDYAGTVVKTITGEGGASQMALDTATHTLYVALHDATAIAEIDTQTLTETTRFSTGTYANPSNIAIAGDKLWFTCSQNGTGCPDVIRADLDGTNMAPAPSPFAGYSFATDLASGGPGNKYLAVGGSETEPPNVDVYDVSGATPTLVSHLSDPDVCGGYVRDMTFDPSGANLLLACGAPYSIESLATSTLQSSAEYPTGPYPISVAVTADGNFVAGGVDSFSPNAFVYSVNSTTPIRTFEIGDDPGNERSHSLAFSPNGSKLFAVAPDANTGHLAFHVFERPTLPLQPSATSMKTSSREVRYGSHATLTVKLTGPKSGTVTLYATTSTQAKHPVANGKAVSGTATFKVAPKENTTYSAQFQEGSGFASSTSRDVHIAVSPIVTNSVGAERKGRYKGHRVTITPLTGRVNPARPGESVTFVVQRRSGARWYTDISGQAGIGSDGIARGRFYTNRVAEFRFRVSYPGDSAFVAATSPWKTFQTTKP